MRPGARTFGFGSWRRQSERRFGGEEPHEIADVNHPLWIVERLAINRQPRMAGRAKQRQNLMQRCVGGDGDDVGPGDHDVGDADIVQSQHVLENGPFLRREVVAGPALVKGILNVIAHGTGAESQHGPHALEQGSLRFARLVAHAFVTIGVAHGASASSRWA